MGGAVLLSCVLPENKLRNEDNGNLFLKVWCLHCLTQCPWACSRPPLTHASARDSRSLMGKSGSVSCGITAAFSWILMSTRFWLWPPRVCFPSCVSSVIKSWNTVLGAISKATEGSRFVSKAYHSVSQYRFSRVQLCATPQTATHQAPLSLGFSRQEHWSGLPFPSPMHESEKWKLSHSAMSDSLQPHGLQPTRLLHPWDFPGKSTGVGNFTVSV